MCVFFCLGLYGSLQTYFVQYAALSFSGTGKTDRLLFAFGVLVRPSAALAGHEAEDFAIFDANDFMMEVDFWNHQDGVRP